MFSFRKKEEESYTKSSETRLSRSEIKKILRTVPLDGAFYFYEGIGKPTVHMARSLADFREKINDVGLRSLVFHLRRKDFESWIRDILGDSELAENVGKIAPDSFDLQVKLYATVSKRIKKLNEMLSASTITSEQVVAAPRFSEAEASR